ncbi:hypothetical protein S40285_07142 [Stachybotrys chlorohalonatus IBT 40285]|uniref:P/Homo B domain-containing protein n=1 Tax=Stachybotrys chlorohalonatus (strain IBT 40285) TaxID=1283841 RepID=A0A084QME2_STAC4|nr:hypothetical protein S40285_07142 [Stachybotrys chlorohalonata IBT 40285]
MKPTLLLGLLGLAAVSHGARIHRDYENNDYYVLHLDANTPPEHVALRLGLRHEGQLSELTDHHVFRAPKHPDDIVKAEIKERRRRKRDIGGSDILDGVLLARKQEARMHLHKRMIPPPPAGHVSPRQHGNADTLALERQSEVIKTLNIADPIFSDQWHLFNPVQVGHDVNVTQVWLDGVTGKNATVAIVDDGLDMHSDDLKGNYFAEGSWDFNDNDPEPAPVLNDDKHGTRCAGEVSAVRNDVCGIGVAYDSKIAGIRILSKPISDADEAEAMIYKYQDNQIYSCSWGPTDDGQSMEAPGVLIRRAMLQGVQQGRGGLGSIYVFASGNGASNGDNCNFDGYTNSIYSITVGAVDRAGKHPYYSELCSAQLVVTYSSGSNDAIHTTDVGTNACYNQHGGTSAAAPLAAGIFALVMEVRPDLTWRDLQYLAMETAAFVDDQSAEWQETAIGKKFSHTFGYGKIDSYAIVEKARTWEKVKPQAWFFSPWLHVNQAIPQGGKGLAVHFEVTEAMLKAANLARLEHVTVTMNVDHKRRGDISVDLESPEGITSHIATDRPSDDHKGGYDDWTFMSVVHWGESGVGKWTLYVRDVHENDKNGTFTDWHLKLWGEAINADQATLLPMPEENDDADHDVIQSTISTAAKTTTLPPKPANTLPPAESNPASNPDHPQRPTRPATNSQPSPTSDGQDGTDTNEAQATSSSAADSSWVSWLPTFGASKSAQVWIYGAIGLIAAFCIGLGIYLWVARRRRLRNSTRTDYEFELLEEDEAQGLNTGEKVVAPGKKRTRGGELYDAFAGGSEDEEDFGDYRDAPAEGRRSVDEDDDRRP